MTGVGRIFKREKGWLVADYPEGVAMTQLDRRTKLDV